MNVPSELRLVHLSIWFTDQMTRPNNLVSGSICGRVPTANHLQQRLETDNVHLRAVFLSNFEIPLALRSAKAWAEEGIKATCCVRVICRWVQHTIHRKAPQQQEQGSQSFFNLGWNLARPD